MSWVDNVTAQMNFVDGLVSTMDDDFNTLSTAVNLTANSALIDKLNLVTGDWLALKEGLNGGATMLSTHYSISPPSGGTDCGKTYGF